MQNSLQNRPQMHWQTKKQRKEKQTKTIKRLQQQQQQQQRYTHFLNSRSGRLAYCPNSANRFRFISKSNCDAPPVENFVFIIMLSMKKSSNWWAINLNAILKMLIESSVSRLCKLVTISYSEFFLMICIFYTKLWTIAHKAGRRTHQKHVGTWKKTKRGEKKIVLKYTKTHSNYGQCESMKNRFSCINQ